jgi:hypothetical protein
MRNPVKSAMRWWLAHKLPADLRAGDICFVQSEGCYKVAKILAVDNSSVHVRLYREKFAQISTPLNTDVLSLGTIHDDDWGMGHLPLSRAMFASWRPIRVQHEVVREEELDGYRMWEKDQGGTWDL